MIRCGSRPAAFLLLGSFAFLCVLLALPGSAAAADCFGCGRPIEGNPLRVDGRSYHASCFRCALCGRTITDRYSREETGDQARYFHEECAASLQPRCGVCGEILRGEYLREGSVSYHRACWERSVAPRCARCNDILQGSIYEKEGERYCSRCYLDALADRCVVCGEPIADGQYPKNFYGETWHESCASRRKTCFVCGRSVGGKGGLPERRLDDGRTLCHVCQAEGLSRKPDAERRLGDVAVELRALGVILDTRDIELVLCGDIDELRRLSGGHKTAGHTLFEERRIFGRTVWSKTTIYLLTHLRRPRFDCVAAHELGHVFIRRNLRRDLPLDVEEGFCNYLASLILAPNDDELSRYLLQGMEEDPDPDYGFGYRRVRDYARGKTMQELLQALEPGAELPAGLW